MDEHMLIEFLVNRIEGMRRLANQKVDRATKASSLTITSAYLDGAQRADAQAGAYLDVLRFLVTFECKHVTECDCAVGGLR